MTDQDQATRIEHLVLLRLLPSSKGISPGKVKTSLLPFVDQVMDARAWSERFDEVASSLVERGLLTRRPFRLTPTGVTEALSLLGQKELSSQWNWTRIKRHWLATAVLGLRPTESTGVANVLTHDALTGQILKAHLRLPGTSAPSRAQAVDALVWRQLGLESDKPLTLAGVRAHVLRGILGTKSKLAVPRLADLLAAKAVHATRPTSDSLQTAILSRWLATGSAVTDSLPTTEPAREQDFVAAVLTAAQSPEARRFGEKKVFIASVWDVLEGTTRLGLSLNEFKQRLLAANRDGLLALSRADLVAAMNPQDVARSETMGAGATFHFINLHGSEDNERPN